MANHTALTHKNERVIFAINMDELQHKKKQQQRNQRPKTKTFPRFFFFFLFSLDAKFFFCSVPNAMFKAHPTLIAETTYTLAHPKWQAKKWPKIQLSSAIPFTMQRVWQLWQTETHWNTAAQNGA